MILRFSVTNHRSIRDEQALSLVATTLRDSPTPLISSPSVGSLSILPTAIIYGANASGKSNLVSAIRFMKNAVLFSHSKGKPGGGVPRRPFRLDDEGIKSPSTFELDFILQNVRYTYGFSANSEAFEEEWLYGFPSNRRQVLFERSGDKFVFGRKLRGQNRVISELTRPNSLFLSTATQNDHRFLNGISESFQKIHVSKTFYGDTTFEFGVDKDVVDKRVLDFLKHMGTGIIESRVKRTNANEKVRSISEKFEKIFAEISDNEIEFKISEELSRIQLGHITKSGKSVFFDIDDESAGTCKLLKILGPIFNALDQGTPVIIDEIDTSLHTLACESIIELF